MYSLRKLNQVKNSPAFLEVFFDKVLTTGTSFLKLFRQVPQDAAQDEQFARVLRLMLHVPDDIRSRCATLDQELLEVECALDVCASEENVVEAQQLVRRAEQLRARKQAAMQKVLAVEQRVKALTDLRDRVSVCVCHYPCCL